MTAWAPAGMRPVISTDAPSDAWAVRVRLVSVATNAKVTVLSVSSTKPSSAVRFFVGATSAASSLLSMRTTSTSCASGNWTPLTLMLTGSAALTSLPSSSRKAMLRVRNSSTDFTAVLPSFSFTGSVTTASTVSATSSASTLFTDTVVPLGNAPTGATMSTERPSTTPE